MSDIDNKVKMIVEGLLLAAGKPLSLDNIAQVFSEAERPDRKELKSVMDAIAADCNDRGFELKEVASGFRFQVKQEIGEWVAKLWEERPPRYTRALLETLALIAYRQPITRGDIEEIRGVAVSPSIIRTLLDREWVRVVGHRDVPGRPALFATTKQFLDYFNIKSLQELPTLSEIKELAQSEPEIDLAEELAKQRVIDLPDEDSEEAHQQNEQEMAELLAEEEAVELSKKPLDEILGMGPYEEDGDDDDADEDDEPDDDDLDDDDDSDDDDDWNDDEESVDDDDLDDDEEDSAEEQRVDALAESADSDDLEFAQDHEPDTADEEAEFLQVFEDDALLEEDADSSTTPDAEEEPVFDVQAADDPVHDEPAGPEADGETPQHKTPDAGASIIDFSTEEAEDDRDF